MYPSNRNKPIPVNEITQNEQDDQVFQLFRLMPKDGNSSVTEPHRHNYYELFLFENGGGSHNIDFQDIKIDPRSIHLVAPGQVHHLKRSQNSVGFAILFMESFLRDNLDNSNFVSKFAYMEKENYEPVFQFSEDEFADVQSIISMIQKEIDNDENLNMSIIQHYLNILVLWCRKKKSKQTQTNLSADQLLYAEFRKQVDIKYKELKKVMEYAQLLNTNERQLNEVSQKCCGKSASALIFERIIMEAKRLIVNTQLSVKEICYELNYDDQAHFSKFFKNQCGYSPSQFRELYI